MNYTYQTVGVAISGESGLPCEYVPPVDRNDRRRRIYRWKRAHPGEVFRRGWALFEDGTHVPIDVLIARAVKASEAKMAEVLGARSRLFDLYSR